MSPMNILPLSRSVVVLGSVLALSACSGLNIDSVGERVDYKNNKSINSLEVPPDLSAPDYDSTYATIPGGSVSAAALTSGEVQRDNRVVLPTNPGIQLMREGNVRWLQVGAPAEAVWPKLQEFWSTMGVDIKRDEPRVGIMETDWAENKAEIPLDFIRKTIGKAFEGAYDAGSRDRFKIRLERPAAQATNIYLSHERAEESVSGTGTKWQYVPARPELEAEMLNRLMVFLQGGDATAATTPTAATPKQAAVSAAMVALDGGQPALAVGGTANDVWIRSGVMLGRIGMSIEGQQRANGIYLTSYSGGADDGKQGFFGRLFSTDKDALKVGSKYQVKIADAGNRSLITVSDAGGNPLKPAVATALLERLKSEFER
ncbi:outer membrane protein assembly factor BamC [Thiothrix lacustris]|uniref:outer membrane protein assembly factor BamC n=1 Tax=Thiothrix lacustris TaxID=525917 RepID=UPI0006871727|nr:outer membrane protein assembly factor BamC [Thiothrix lacustris]